LFFFNERSHESFSKKSEKIIFILWTALLLIFFSYLNQGFVYIFGRPLYGDEWTEDRGVEKKKFKKKKIFKKIFRGAGIFILALFISITKFDKTTTMMVSGLGFSLLWYFIPSYASD